MATHNSSAQNRNGFKHFLKKNILSLSLYTLLWTFIWTIVICASALLIYMLSLDAEIHLDAQAMKLNYSSIVYYVDEDGVEHEFERLYDTQNRTWVNLDDMPSHLKDAAIAIEDHRFMKHHGVDWTRTMSASANLFFKFKSDYGASTITQQLVKNLTGDNQDSVKRKLQEIMRALYLERTYSKDEILEMYLNTIYLGEGCYGVGTAAQAYYGKNVSELTVAESAALIGITNLPTYYNPYINLENNTERRNTIINRMYDLDMISKEERDDALAEEIVFNTEKRETTSVQSYFVDQIIEDLVVDLMEERGYSKNVAIKTIYSGGLKIYATVNPEIQSAMDKVFESNDTFPKYSGSVQPECSMIMLDPQNGNIVAMRGGRGKKTGARILNRATQTKRPPGSSIKPISVYAPAIEYGLITPYSVEDDAPIMVLDNSAYPKNETRTYSGRTNINEAVKQSINTVSMRTLEKLTIERSYNFLSANLGITSLSSKNDRNLAPLALGQLTDGITALEIAAAYVPFANGGTYYEPRTYTKVLDHDGNVLIEKEQHPTRAMSEKTAAYMTHMLSNVVTSGTGTYAQLDRGMPAAAKTGTSDDDKDRWFVGYTPYYVGAAWFGYDQQKTIPKSLSPALTVWKRVMNSAHADLEVKSFPQNDEFQYVNVCSRSGLLPTDACRIDPRGSQIIAGYFHKDDVPTETCNVHVSVDIDTQTNMMPSEFCPDENRKTVGLIKLDRFFKLGGIVLGDEQYVIHESTPPEGEFYYSSGTSSPMGSVCTRHSYDSTPEVEEPVPEYEYGEPYEEEPSAET